MPKNCHKPTYKARLVARGYSQSRGIDYEETFSPVIKFESTRVILALSAQLNFSVHHLDVTSAFLNGTLDKVLYMAQPEGFQIIPIVFGSSIKLFMA